MVSVEFKKPPDYSKEQMELFISEMCKEAGIVPINTSDIEDTELSEADSNALLGLLLYFEEYFLGGRNKFSTYLNTIFQPLGDDVPFVEVSWPEEDSVKITQLAPSGTTLAKGPTEALVYAYDISYLHGDLREFLKPLVSELYLGLEPHPTVQRLGFQELEEYWWRWRIDQIHPHVYNAVAAHLDSRILKYFEEESPKYPKLHENDVLVELEDKGEGYRFFELYLSGGALFFITTEIPFTSELFD